MSNVALIPVRGGSKSIPLKNIKEICGKPLVYWTIKAANECLDIDEVYVATDSQIIKDTVEKFSFDKVKVIDRGADTATDTASTESVMLEFATKYKFDNIVLIQATSPLLNRLDLDKGFELYTQDGTDSVLSAVRQKRFNWKIDDKGYAIPINYDVYHRPRRQEFDGYLVENGAFYITSRERLLSSKNRVSGNMKIVEMDEATFWEIDEPSDWIMIEMLMKQKLYLDKKIPNIKLFLTDCDGCLTDGGMYYSEKGDELKKFNTKDGMGFKILHENNILTGIITGESVHLNKRRADKLQLDFLIPGCTDKLKAIKKICTENKLSLENVLYVGDDINDLDAIQNVGLGCCVADANPQIKEAARYITKSKGGEGAIRELVDMLFAVKIMNYEL